MSAELWPVRAGRAALVLALLAASAGSAQASVTEGSLSFTLNGRADPRDGTLYSVVPLYAGIHLGVRDVSLRYADDVRLELNGWLGGLLGEPIGGQHFTGDLDLFSIEARFAHRHLHVKLGRQLVIGGVARFTHLDGAAVTLEHKGFGITAFGGIPVIPRFAVTVGDATGGARVFYRFNYESQLGLSFIHVQDHGRTGRQDIGIDFRARPFRVLTLAGLGVLNLVERDLVEVDLSATVAAHRTTELRLDFRHQRPDLFVPRASIFSVFANSNRQEAGAQLVVRPVRRIDLYADYHLILDETGKGHRAGLTGQVRLGPTGELTLGTNLRMLHLRERGYEEVRVFAAWRLLPTLLATLDGDAYWFNNAINGRSWSMTGAASVAWDFRPRWRVVVSGAGSSTPFVDGGFDVMAKLAYNPSYRFSERP